MKKVICLLACGALLAACEGKGGGTKLSENEHLGKVPALYAAFETTKTTLESDAEARGQKMVEGGEENYDKVQKIFDDAQAKIDAAKAQFDTDVEAEMAKIVGRTVPVTFSTALGTPFYDIKEAKIVDQNGAPHLALTIVAREAFTVPAMQAYDYSVYYVLKNAEGAIAKSASVILPITLAREDFVAAAGQKLNDATVPLAISSRAAALTTFTGIEFITKQEYENQ